MWLHVVKPALKEEMKGLVPLRASGSWSRGVLCVAHGFEAPLPRAVLSEGQSAFIARLMRLCLN